MQTCRLHKIMIVLRQHIMLDASFMLTFQQHYEGCKVMLNRRHVEDNVIESWFCANVLMLSLRIQSQLNEELHGKFVGC